VEDLAGEAGELAVFRSGGRSPTDVAVMNDDVLGSDHRSVIGHREVAVLVVMVAGRPWRVVAVVFVAVVVVFPRRVVAERFPSRVQLRGDAEPSKDEQRQE